MHPIILPNESIHGHRRQLKRKDRPNTKVETQNKSIEFKLNCEYPMNEQMLRSEAMIYLNTKECQLQQRNENVKAAKADKKLIITIMTTIQ